MREVATETYAEPRDALARDWGRFMAEALPEAAWLPIPNLGAAVLDYATRWQLDGLILSSGDDLGSAPLRDQTERALLHHFLGRGLPVFGVCRGLQLVWSEFGGRLLRQSGHAGTRHLLQLADAPAGLSCALLEVNSFHAWTLAPGVPPGLQAWATAEDGSVEAISAARQRLTAVMWHPERESATRAEDRQLLRWLFAADQALQEGDPCTR